MLVLVDQQYSTEVPAFGGSISEGVLGKPLLINPLLAVTDADRDLVDLMYAGLMRSDGNGNIIPELAASYEVSEDGRTYTFSLRNDALWHDGKPVTAADVVFTVETAKIPELRSPSRANWEGITATAVDDHTVQFSIQGKAYAPFITNTTLGILPKHVWEGVSAEQFLLREQNLEPIGAGPYKFDSFQVTNTGVVTSYALTAWDAFVPRRPYIRSLNIYFYNGPKELLAAYTSGKVDNILISPTNAPSELTGTPQLHELQIPKLFFVFYNQSKSPVLADPAVRNALDAATDRQALAQQAINGYGNPEADPVLLGRTITKSALTPEEILQKGGWVRAEDGSWQKKTKTGTLDLKFSLSTSNNDELVRTAELLTAQWKTYGIEATLEQFDLQGLQTARIRPREYEALLFGQVIGYQPDPYAFWHSSQRTEGGNNVSMYTSTTVDKLLENIRENITPEKRAEYLTQFANEFQKDKPALVLFQLNDIYLTRDHIQGVDIERVNLPSERFARVEDWFIETRKVWNVLIDE